MSGTMCTSAALQASVFSRYSTCSACSWLRMLSHQLLWYSSVVIASQRWVSPSLTIIDFVPYIEIYLPRTHSIAV